MVDKEIIKKRKAEYGDAIENIAHFWNAYLDFDLDSLDKLTPWDVCMMMALMKDARLVCILNKAPSDVDIDEFRKTDPSYIDNIKDRENYHWIANNWEEYKTL